MLNNILRALALSDRTLIERHLVERKFPAGLILAEAGDELETVYFPNTAVIAYLVPLNDGSFVQTHLVGYDGMVGAEQAQDHKTSTNRIAVQVAGTVATVSRETLRAVLERRPGVRQLFAAYEQFVIAEIQQTAACNAKHSVRQRTARWLLRMRDLAGDAFPITQDALANMMAVRRTSISEEMPVMVQEGAINHQRGKVEVTSVKRLKAACCECHEAVTKNYEVLLYQHWPHLKKKIAAIQ